MHNEHNVVQVLKLLGEPVTKLGWSIREHNLGLPNNLLETAH